MDLKAWQICQAFFVILERRIHLTLMGNKQLILLSHIGTLLGYAVAFGNFIVPLAIWLSKRDESKAVAEHAKESLNFQISMALYSILAAFLIIVLVGIPLLIVLVIINLICVIVATMKADRGEFYRYPFTIRLIK